MGVGVSQNVNVRPNESLLFGGSSRSQYRSKGTLLHRFFLTRLPTIAPNTPPEISPPTVMVRTALVPQNWLALPPVEVVV
jgi:hypothetical protein